MIQQTYAVYQVIGAVAMGSLMTFFREKLPPSAIVVAVLFASLLGQLPMIWPGSAKEFLGEPMRIAVATASFAEGGLLVALASLVHEEYGTESFGLLYGTMLTFGAAGLFALNELLFPSIFEWYAEESASGYDFFRGYGQWNVTLFTVFTVMYFLCTVLAIASHISIRKRESGEADKFRMIQF